MFNVDTKRSHSEVLVYALLKVGQKKDGQYLQNPNKVVLFTNALDCKPENTSPVATYTRSQHFLSRKTSLLGAEQ